MEGKEKTTDDTDNTDCQDRAIQTISVKSVKSVGIKISSCGDKDKKQLTDLSHECFP